MLSTTYDIIIVGGGLGGSALAKAMAERGASVLVLEKETRFRDRVRGEYMEPWGVAEAKRLGIYDTLIAAGGHELRWWNAGASSRDLPATTAQKVGALSFYHPHMQEGMIEAARHAGAEVCRGATARVIESGRMPAVVAEIDGQADRLQARLVVAADGRGSLARQWAGFDVRRDPDRLLIAGVLYEAMDVPSDASHTWRDSEAGRYVLFFPQGNRRVRAYLSYAAHAGYRLSGDSDLSQFVELSVSSGAPAAYFAGVKAIGPLATFAGADAWVEHPYRLGVAVIGDAAASSDPTWGQGLSLTARDVRVLRDALLRNDHWDEAGHAYAEEHDRYYGALHTWEAWVTQMFMTTGTEADALRGRAMPLWRADPSRVPDVKSGPDWTLDETARKRFFGEE